MNNEIIYVILRNGIFLFFAITGYALYVNKKYPYWLVALPSITIYALVEGLRYGRGQDYFHYKKIYENALHLDRYWPSDSIEPFFRSFNVFFYSLGVDSSWIFCFYSLLLIFSFFFFIRKYLNHVVFAPILFLFATIVQSENLIRSFFAFSFILMAVSSFLSGQRLRFIVFFVIAIFSHSSVIVFLPALLLVRNIKFSPTAIIVVIVAYCLTWLWNPDWWGQYASFYSNINLGDEHYQNYLDNADDWLSGSDKTAKAFSLLGNIRLFAFNFYCLYFGYKYLKNDERLLSPVFGLFVIGAIGQKLVWNMEIPSRIILYFYMFWFFVFAYILEAVFVSTKSSIFVKIISAFILLSACYDFLAPSLELKRKSILFIWSI